MTSREDLLARLAHLEEEQDWIEQEPDPIAAGLLDVLEEKDAIHAALANRPTMSDTRSMDSDSPLTLAELHDGDLLYHRRRRQHCTYLEPDHADPSGKTAWVDFGDGDVVMVSTSLLARPTP